MYIIPIGFRLFEIAEFISNREQSKKYSAKWDRGFTVCFISLENGITEQLSHTII